MKQYPQLRHCQRGVVSVSLTGDEFLIALTRCLHRDDTHQVALMQRPQVFSAFLICEMALTSPLLRATKVWRCNCLDESLMLFGSVAVEGSSGLRYCMRGWGGG